MNCDEIYLEMKKSIKDIVMERYKDESITAEDIENEMDYEAEEWTGHLYDKFVKNSHEFAEEMKGELGIKEESKTPVFSMSGMMIVGGDSIEEIEKGIAMIKQMFGKG